MRRRFGALLAATMTSIAFAAGIAQPAAAQTSEFECTFSVPTTTLAAPGGSVTVSGTAPGSAFVRVFVNGVEAATTTAASGTGAWSVNVVITATSEVTVALDGYPTTPCSGVGGQGVFVGGISATKNLSLTGSSATRQLVLIGIAALSIGIVLVVGSRRRLHVHGRA